MSKEQVAVIAVPDMHYAMQELEEQHALMEGIENLLCMHGWERK